MKSVMKMIGKNNARYRFSSLFGGSKAIRRRD